MPSDDEPSITPEMRTLYLMRRHADVDVLQAAILNGDFVTMKSIAHVIKGNAATFSYVDLERFAVDLEHHAENASLENSSLVIESIKQWLARQTL